MFEISGTPISKLCSLEREHKKLCDKQKIFFPFLERDFCNLLKSMHFLSYFTIYFSNLTENLAKYSKVTKKENMYTIRVCNMIFHLINT